MLLENLADVLHELNSIFGFHEKEERWKLCVSRRQNAIYNFFSIMTGSGIKYLKYFLNKESLFYQILSESKLSTVNGVSKVFFFNFQELVLDDIYTKAWHRKIPCSSTDSTHFFKIRSNRLNFIRENSKNVISLYIHR